MEYFMDERLEKALDSVNLMTTISNQKTIFFEEYQQSIVHYQNGGIFLASPDLITFVKTVVDMGYDGEYVLIDRNDNPIKISNIKDFLKEILDKYSTASNDYYTKSQQIKTRSIDKLTAL
jgi:hypothetical protein